MHAGDEVIRREMRESFGALTGEMGRLHEELKSQMLMLHEDTTAKFALFREAFPTDAAPTHTTPRGRRRRR